MWWQEPRQLGQLRCALSSGPNLAFVQMHDQYLLFVSQSKLTGILPGSLQGIQTRVLFETARTWELCSPGIFLVVDVSNILKFVLSEVNLGQDRT